MLFGSSVALQEIGLLANIFLGGFSFSLSSPVLLFGQAKSGSGFPHRTRLVFFFLSFSFCVWVPLFLSNLAALCLGRLKSALRFCGRRVAPGFFCGRAPPLCGPSWVSGLGWPEARCFPLFLSRLLLFLLFFFVVWCGHTFSNAPSPSGSTVGL